MDQPITNRSEAFVFNYFKENGGAQLLFHDYKHTDEVVKNVNEIGSAMHVTEEDLEVLNIAAWFHDTGYLSTRKGHEAVSAEIAKKFLDSESYPAEKTKKILELIAATEMEKEPQNYLEEIMCDADTLNIGTNEYLHRSKLLRSENKSQCGEEMTDAIWIEWELKFLYAHQFYTRYALLNYSDGKTRNILAREDELAKIKRKQAEIKEKKTDKEVKKSKSEVPARGIETMFRTTLRNHINLSAIADNKANLMLSVNAVIVSIIVSLLLPNYKSNPELIMPSIFLMAVCLLSIVFATLSTRPKVTRGTFTKDDIANKKANLLFFGNFFRTDIDEFEWGMGEMMKDKDFLYGAMIRDLHSLGKVLNHKYRYLRLTYNIFMFGIVLSVIFYALSLNFDMIY